ncbi:MAG: lysophospholipid acyltransferase family protein [Myxococcaceae bacterium]
MLATLAGFGSGMLRALQTGVGTSGATDLDAYGKDAHLVDDLEPIRNFLYDRYWRVSVEGIQNIPAGPVLLVANHSGSFPFDGPILQEAIRRERPELNEARWLVEDQVFYAPFVGTLLNRVGAVRACPENALRLLGEARPVIVFPEGLQGIGKPFRERYRLMRFGRGGVVKISLRTRAPIIPVAIVGAEESMPLLGKIPAKPLGVPYVPITSPLPLPARWSIRFGEPISIEGHGPESVDDLLLVQTLNDRTRESIQQMIDGILRERTSIFA